MNNTQDLINIIDGLTALAHHFADGSPYESKYAEETLLKDAAFTIEQQLPISVSKRLPPIDPQTCESEDVLAYHPTCQCWDVARVSDISMDGETDIQWCWTNDRIIDGDPSHWLPMIPAP